jgi:hypothetical protein
MALFSIVDQATRSANQNINTTFEHFQLFIVAIATVCQTKFQTCFVRKCLGIRVNLNG